MPVEIRRNRYADENVVSWYFRVTDPDGEYLCGGEDYPSKRTAETEARVALKELQAWAEKKQKPTKPKAKR